MNSLENGSVGSSVGNTKPTSKRVTSKAKWCFTFNNYGSDDIDSLIVFFDKMALKYVFQEETGENGTPHLQGCVHFKKKCRPLEHKELSKKIHWEACKNWEASIEYCSKLDTRTGTVFTNLKLARPLKLITKLYKWQQDIYHMLTQEPDDRSIYWYWEPDGNIGKTQFCKYICIHLNAICLSGKAADCKYMIVKYKEKHNVYPDIVIYDIPRTMQDYVSFEALESIKNGFFFSSKYECDQVIMNSPHVICFANHEPDVFKVSLDRWKITRLEKEVNYS